jgi:hypothetical protein
MPTRLNKTRQKLTLFKFDRHFSKDILIDEDEIFCHPLRSPEPVCFLGVVTPEQLRTMFRRFRVFSGLKKRGFEKVVLESNSRDGYNHVFRVFYNGSVLIEALLHKTTLPLEKSAKKSETQDVLFVEWLLLQNPFRDFDDQRPQLPGQRRPGLGLAKEVMNVLVELTKLCGLGGLAAVPGHYHNAVIFSKSFKYLNAECEGKLRALRRDLSGYPLAMVSWAVELNCVKNADTGEYLSWFIDWQVLGISGPMKKYFAARDYRDSVNRTFRESRYLLDEAKFNVEKEKIPRLAEVII